MATPRRTSLAPGIVRTKISAARSRQAPATALGIIRQGMDRVLMVDDAAVKDAMRAYFVDTHNVAEGAGAIGMAALLQDRAAGGKRVGTVLCGGNVDSDVFAEVLRGGRRP